MNTIFSDLTRLCSAVFLGTLVWLHWPSSPPPPQMPQWEYTIQSISDLSFSSDMNNLGKQGWEMVFARRATSGPSYDTEFNYEAIFKRPLMPPPP